MHPKTTPTVLVIGPDTSRIGGIASVVRQMHSLDMPGRWRLVPFTHTSCTDVRESRVRKLTRHMRHLRSLGTQIRRFDASIVHIHTCSGFSFFRSLADVVVARRFNCRTVLHIHGARFDEFFEAAGYVGRRLVTWGLSHCDRVVALSQRWRDELHRMAPKASVSIIENAVELPAAPARTQSGGHCHFLLLAKMDLWKGVDDLLEACAALRQRRSDFRLTLAGPAGTAGDAPTIERKIAAHGIQDVLRYVGPVQGEDKHSLLSRADVYVQPSHHEGMPISLLEALAFGLPVVATGVGAVPEVLTHGEEGWLVPSHNPAALAAAMGEAIEDVPRRRSMSAAARSLAESRFSMSRFCADLMALYDELPTRRSEHRPRPVLSTSMARPA